MAMRNTAAPLSIVGLGMALMATLVVLYVVCLVVALIFPAAPLAHAWVGLFTTAPLTSVGVWIEGIVANVVAAWLIAVVFGLIYNRAAA
ncbi:MAG TPA: hypothetical protein VFK86_04950 [Bauldia sp.]|nr:hypothetical protein [Bauldia sp.]